MNYVVPARTFRNLKSIDMRANSFSDLVRSKLFPDQRFIVASFNLNVSAINQNRIINVELPSFLNMKRTSFMVNTLEDIVDVVAHNSHSVETFFCGRRGEFIVFIEVHGAWIKDIEISAGGEFVSSGGSGVVGKFCEK